MAVFVRNRGSGTLQCRGICLYGRRFGSHPAHR